MLKKLLTTLGAAAIALLVVLPASAHHSYAEFDRSQTVEITGTVKEWRWLNPHSWLYVIAPGPDGARDAEWAIETGSLANMSRVPGWSRTVMKSGDAVTVVLNPRRDGGAGGSLVSVTLADGQTISPFGGRVQAATESSEGGTQ